MLCITHSDVHGGSWRRGRVFLGWNSPSVLRFKKTGYQHGVALVVVLLFLVAIASISVWTIRQSMMSEGMARNQLDQEVARQAAEAALRDAERDIEVGTPPAGAACTRPSVYRNSGKLMLAAFTATCQSGLCYKPDAEYAAVNWSSAAANTSALAEPWWPKSKAGLWNDDISSKPPAGGCNTFVGGVPLGTYTNVKKISGVAKQPEYLIEAFKRKDVRINQAETMVVGSGVSTNQWSTMYRITARGFGYTTKTQVVLQSIYFP